MSDVKQRQRAREKRRRTEASKRRRNKRLRVNDLQSYTARWMKAWREARVLFDASTRP